MNGSIPDRANWLPRFGLRSLVVLVCSAAVLFAVGTWQARKMHANAATLERLQQGLGTVGVVSPVRAEPTSLWQRICGAPELEICAAVVHFGDFDEDVCLGAYDDPARLPVFDADLLALEPCPVVEVLKLNCTAITDAVLPQLHERFPQVGMLSLERTAVSAAGLEQLRTLPNLRVLNLKGCPLDDQVIDVLTRLPRLEAVDLSGTKVTTAGVEALRAQRPKLQVSQDPAL